MKILGRALLFGVCSGAAYALILLGFCLLIFHSVDWFEIVASFCLAVILVPLTSMLFVAVGGRW